MINRYMIETWTFAGHRTRLFKDDREQALASQEILMCLPYVQRCEVTDLETNHTKGRSKPMPRSAPSPERDDTSRFNREYDIAPWAYDGD